MCIQVLVYILLSPLSMERAYEQWYMYQQADLGHSTWFLRLIKKNRTRNFVEMADSSSRVGNTYNEY